MATTTNAPAATLRRPLGGRQAAQSDGLPARLAHLRLTPDNCHDLLFDDVIWVQEARPNTTRSRR